MKNKFDYCLLNFLIVILFSFAGCSVANSKETKNTAPTFHVQTQNPDAKPTRVIPEYVTAWPKQVTVEKPDPILGDKLVWEHWIYGEEFAKRFEGFSLEKADKELQNSPIKAITLRIYKDNLWKSSFPNYVQQYSCNVNVFFDNSIQLPQWREKTEKRHIAWMDYPKGISTGYLNLKPISLKDKEIFLNAQILNKTLHANPVIFADKPLDGRFAALGVREYIPQFIENISVINLQAGIECEVIGPKAESGVFWLSLFGKSPYFAEDDERSKMATRGTYKETNKIFEPGEHPEAKGYVKLPHSFYEVALPKMALIEDLNYCISQHYSYEKNTNKQPSQKRDEFFQWCEDAKSKGLIFHPSDYLSNKPKQDGLSKTGF